MQLARQSTGGGRFRISDPWRSGRQSVSRPNVDPTLTLDLQFARDQAYVSRRGPLPTFTRASAAWRINSAGVIVPAAVNEARVDFNPTTLACRGLAVEEQRTNLTTRSEDLTNAAWGKINTTATADQTTSPDGTVDADLLAETTTNASHYATTNAVSITSGVAYTTSVFLKKGSGATAPDWVVLSFLAGAFGSKAIAFNVSTGATGAAAGGQTAVVTQMQNGWWRIALTATALVTTSASGLYLAFTNNANSASTPSYAGLTTSNVFVWGAQFEAGAFATSYIPTTSASVIRSADVCSITGGAFSGFWNTAEGTMVCAYDRNGTASESHATADDGTANNRLVMQFSSIAERFGVSVGGVGTNIDSATVGAVRTKIGHAARYKLNDYAFCCNGTAVATNTSVGVPAVTQLTIGNQLGGLFVNGHIYSFQYFNRAKTNAQLQQLSTP